MRFLAYSKESGDIAISKQDSLSFTFIKMKSRDRIDGKPILSLALNTIHINIGKLFGEEVIKICY